MKNNDSYEPYPHAPDVGERERMDNGFSKGWGMHFPACEDYWFEAHTHFGDVDGLNSKIENVLAKQENILDEFGVKKSAVIFRTYDEMTGWKPIGTEEGDFYTKEKMLEYAQYFKNQDRFYWIPWFRYKDPNVSLLSSLIDAGACCIKLHNAYLISEASDPSIWYSDGWQQMFSLISESGLPVLWHVTQRLSSCPYRFMGAYSYWKVGIPKGVTYTNQTLLDVFLNIVEKYPKINFIGAHQLHLGFERLGELFNKHPNLYIDTSIGCFLKPDDDFYPDDKEYIRNFFIKYYDRILFATDVYYQNPEMATWKFRSEYEGHIRFIRRLNLPDFVLQAISHGNAEKLYLKK